MDDALARTTAALGMEVGILSRIDGSTYTVLAVHPGDAVAVGATFELGLTFCQVPWTRGRLLAVPDLLVTEHHTHPAYAHFGVAAYIGAPVHVDGEPFGTVNFSSSTPRAEGWTAEDRERVLRLAREIGTSLPVPTLS